MAITISGTTVTYNDSSTTTTNTPNATAALSEGAIGSYAYLGYPANNASRAPGFTIAGSSLRYAGGQPDQISGTAPGGSWRLMGALPLTTSPIPKGGVSTSTTLVSVWLRYA